MGRALPTAMSVLACARQGNRGLSLLLEERVLEMMREELHQDMLRRVTVERPSGHEGRRSRRALERWKQRMIQNGVAHDPNKR